MSDGLGLVTDTDHEVMILSMHYRRSKSNQDCDHSVKMISASFLRAFFREQRMPIAVGN